MFYAVAIILILSKLFKLLSYSKGIFAPLLSYRPDLGARYGKGSWAVITGASDGLGKAFACELADHGFNLVLLGHHKEKLEEVSNELKSKHSSLQTKIISRNFEDSHRENFAEEIASHLKDLDVSFLINNAGTSIGGPYLELSSSDIRDLVLVNCLAPALLTRAFLPLLSGRKKSAMITVSSIAADCPKPNLLLYSASKVFVDYMSRGLIAEHKNIDFLSLRPIKLATQLSGKQAGGEVVTPEACVKSTLRSLGYTDYTYGNWKHSLQAFLRLTR